MKLTQKSHHGLFDFTTLIRLLNETHSKVLLWVLTLRLFYDFQMKFIQKSCCGFCLYDFSTTFEWNSLKSLIMHFLSNIATIIFLTGNNTDWQYFWHKTWPDLNTKTHPALFMAPPLLSPGRSAFACGSFLDCSDLLLPGPLRGNQGLHANILWGLGGAFSWQQSLFTPTGHPKSPIE